MVAEDPVISAAAEEPVIERSSHPRKRYTRDFLLDKFKQTAQLDFSIFEKGSLTEHVDFFSSSEESGLGLFPVALKDREEAKAPL